jgi:photosystem II stability/assembly factor-like uncharacterized protein
MTHRTWVLLAALGMAAGCGEDEHGGASAVDSALDGKFPPAMEPSLPGVWVQQVIGTSEDLWDVAAVDARRAWVADANGYCHRTQDGGATWVSMGPFPGLQGSPGAPSTMTDLQFLDESHGWACSERLLVSTSDGGATWTKRQESLPREVGGGLVSWMYSPLFKAMSFISPTTGWLVTSGKLSMTTDGGETWTPVNTGGASVEAVKFIDSQTGWMTAGRQIYRTSDQGKTWQVVAQLDHSDVQVHGIFAVNDTRAWVLGSGGHGKFMFGTSDGNAWEERLTGAGVGRVQFVDAANGWVAGGQIRRSSDGGATWTVQRTPQYDFHGLAFVDASVGWVVGSRGVVLKTETGGQ